MATRNRAPMRSLLFSVCVLVQLGRGEAVVDKGKADLDNRRLDDGLRCCSWNFKNCGNSDWCNASEGNCHNGCNGFYIAPTLNNAGCTKRWQGCSSDGECCDDGVGNLEVACLDLGNYNGCQLRGCCSWDLKTCGSTSDWCNHNEDNCESNCNGFWIDRAVLDEQQMCKKRWEGCSQTSDCCYDGNPEHYMQCQFKGGYWGCQLTGKGPPLGGTPNPPPGNSLSKAPTEPPTSSPTEAPIAMPTNAPINPTTPPTEAPVNPTWAPSNNPTATPSKAPFNPTASPSINPTVSPTEAPVNPTPPPVPSPSSPPVATPSASPEVGTTPVTPQTCCSWNMKDCGTDAWCNDAESNCEDACNGHWVDMAQLDADCVARWGYCGDSTACCNDGQQDNYMTCQQLSGYTGCQISTEPMPTPTTPEPTQPPVANPPPTSEPTPIPTDPQPTTLTPASNPTDQPTLSPLTSAPFPPSGGSPFPVPVGPYITLAGSSERVTIPQPPNPSNWGTGLENCPHLQSGLLNWHDVSTWGGSLPRAGDDVTIPENSKIVISDSVVEELNIVTIPSTSELIVGDNPSGISVHAHGFDVQGSLIIGSEDCRTSNPVSITLHGSRPSDIVWNARAETYKGISVTGTISLHGKRYFQTWSRLAKTVEVNDDVILLQNSVNWEPGMQIVLVTTAVKDSREWHQNEVLTISAVHPNPPEGVGAAIRVDSGVSYRHVANSGYQAEVGLLTRRIVVQGAGDDSEPMDPDPLNCDAGRSVWGNSDAPCFDKELTGFGGHIMVHSGGVGYVEGVELYRMGQTNVLGRYPMHFHLIGSCPTCYFRDSSVHRSFYRCISLHGVNDITTTENVAYDVTGFCYYLEDGVEERNVVSFSLAAHIHSLGDTPWGYAQTTDVYVQSNTLTLPADVTAAGFYITNVHNYVIGNAASGGWAGFAFPNLATPLGPHKDLNFRPSTVTSLELDGNTCHSTGWWWYHTGGFYFGGALYYRSDNLLEYNPGRSFNFNRDNRRPCNVNPCDLGDCTWGCPGPENAWIRLSNSKAFLVPGPGLNSWSGRMEVIGFETHDVGLASESLAAGFYIHDMLAVCRTGEPIVMPPGSDATRMKGDGFFWYDTAQEHIITQSTFRNCGYRSEEYNQYDTSPTRGCGDDAETGCGSGSTVFGFLTHSDQHTPEVMQGTRDITFENCGRRFKLHNFRGDDEPSTVSGRAQNWLDADGSVTLLYEPSIIGSGLEDAKFWWEIDDDVVYDPHGPLRFIKQNNGPYRGVGHFTFKWDDAIHNGVGGSVCGNGSGAPCPALGYVRHIGPKFSSDLGLPITARPDIVGPVGGFGWYIELNGGSPRTVRIDQIEVKPGTPLLISMPYPPGTTFTITAYAAYCSDSAYYTCSEQFTQVSSVGDVRNSLGNTYHFSSQGLLTLRIIQTPQTFTGRPEWFLPTYDDLGKWNSGYALSRFERGGVLLPQSSYGPYMTIIASCAGGVYCSEMPPSGLNPDPCPSGFNQVAYDTCCSAVDANDCYYSDGSTQL